MAELILNIGLACIVAIAVISFLVFSAISLRTFYYDSQLEIDKKKKQIDAIKRGGY